MTLVHTNDTFPGADEVALLYQQVTTAYETSLITSDQWHHLVDLAATAESHEDLDEVRAKLKEYTSYAVE